MHPSAGEDLLLTREGRVATLWLNRPAKRNAVTLGMWRGIATHVAELAADTSVRVLVVRGVGDHFCAGADISELGERDPDGYEAATRAADDGLADFPKPTVAFIQGSCVGGGAEIAIACDLRIADASARFGITPARLGIIYPTFALERAVRLIGVSAAKHLLYSAELIDADRALLIGLVDEVHAEGAEERVTELAQTMAEERSALTQEATKDMIAGIARAGRVEPSARQRWAAIAMSSTDSDEGIAAFLEQRPPRFTWPD